MVSAQVQKALVTPLTPGHQRPAWNAFLSAFPQQQILWERAVLQSRVISAVWCPVNEGLNQTDAAMEDRVGGHRQE